MSNGKHVHGVLAGSVSPTTAGLALDPFFGAGGNVNPLHRAGRKQTGHTPLVKGERLLEEAGSTLDRQEKHQLLHGFEIEGLLSPRLPET